MPYIIILLVKILASIMPYAKMPTCIMDDNDYNCCIWKYNNYIQYILDDCYPNNPNGLTYGDNIQFGTLSSILQM